MTRRPKHRTDHRPARTRRATTSRIRPIRPKPRKPPIPTRPSARRPTPPNPYELEQAEIDRYHAQENRLLKTTSLKLTTPSTAISAKKRMRRDPASMPGRAASLRVTKKKKGLR